MRLERFKRAHARLFTDYGEPHMAPFLVADEATLDLAEDNESWSAFAGEIFLGCGGFVQITDYRAMTWCLLQPGYTKHFLGFHRVMMRLMDNAAAKYPRIEAYIDPDYSQAVRWIKMLGFKVECESKPYYLPDGRDAAEWVRLRGSK